MQVTDDGAHNRTFPRKIAPLQLLFIDEEKTMMFRSAQFGRALSAAATLALLAGCSGGGSSVPAIPATHPGAASQSISQSSIPHFKLVDALVGKLQAPSTTLRFYDPNPFDPTAPKKGLYGANYGNASGNQLGGYFNLYKLPASSSSMPVCANGGLNKVAEINGIGVDSTGTLWVPGLVPTNLTSGIVLTFTKNTCTKATAKLTDKGGEPADIAFTSTGKMYVMDIVNFPAMTNGQIEVYPKGKTKPTTTLQLPGEQIGTGTSQGLGLGIATDSSNNVYATYLNTNKGTDITVFTGGKGSGTVLQSTNGVDYEGMTFDANGNLVVAADSSGGATIDVFAPPFTGTPTTFAAQGSVVDLKLDPAGANLYVGDAANNTIDVYKYPSGTYEFSVVVTTVPPNGAVVEGVAVDPSDNN
jgi:hypothetical protein